MDIPPSAFIGGLFGASMLGLMDTESEVPTQIPVIKAISIRFDPDVNLVKETIKENFLNQPSDILLKNNSKYMKLEVWKEPRKSLDDPLLVLGGCKYDEYKNDAFLTVSIRSGAGTPNPAGITLLRHFIKKLQDKKIKFEIW